MEREGDKKTESDIFMVLPPSEAVVVFKHAEKADFQCLGFKILYQCPRLPLCRRDSVFRLIPVFPKNHTHDGDHKPSQPVSGSSSPVGQNDPSAIQYGINQSNGSVGAQRRK